MRHALLTEVFKREVVEGEKVDIARKQVAKASGIRQVRKPRKKRYRAAPQKNRRVRGVPMGRWSRAEIRETNARFVFIGGRKSRIRQSAVIAAAAPRCRFFPSTNNSRPLL